MFATKTNRIDCPFIKGSLAGIHSKGGRIDACGERRGISKRLRFSPSIMGVFDCPAMTKYIPRAPQSLLNPWIGVVVSKPSLNETLAQRFGCEATQQTVLCRLNGNFCPWTTVEPNLIADGLPRKHRRLVVLQYRYSSLYDGIASWINYAYRRERLNR